MEINNLIGNTPLIKLDEGIYAKAEFYNLSGSIKDRMVSYIIDTYEKKNMIRKGDTIIEATSGNTGIALSLQCHLRGYKCIIIMPSNMSYERKQQMKLYGAKLIYVDEGCFDKAIELRNKMAKENNYISLDQFHNQLNINAHYHTTAFEIINDCKENNIKIDAFVSGCGTGGTITGVYNRFIKENIKADIYKVCPSDGKTHLIHGIGDGGIFLSCDVKCEIINISDKEALEGCRELLNKGLFVGMSSGANYIASKKVRALYPHKNIITIMCDRGERYFSIFQNTSDQPIEP